MDTSTERTCERLLRREEAAALPGIRVRSLYRLVAAGELPGPVRLGMCSRFSFVELQEYVEGLKRKRLM